MNGLAIGAVAVPTIVVIWVICDALDGAGDPSFFALQVRGAFVATCFAIFIDIHLLHQRSQWSTASTERDGTLRAPRTSIPVTPRDSSVRPRYKHRSAAQTQVSANFLIKWFRGDERLWKPFWFGQVIGSYVFNLVLVLGVGFARNADLDAASLWSMGRLLFYVYLAWILIAVWRCAFNVELAFWGYLARINVIALAIGWALHFAIQGLFSILR